MVTDEELVRRFQRGDETAFSEFVSRHQDRMYRLALLWSFDAQDAEDVVQEAFMRSYTGLRRFAFRAQPTTWLTRIVRNVCHEVNRKRPLTSADVVDEPDPHAPDPERDETVREIRRLVAHLPQRQRDVVILRIFEELPVADTARVMGCRPGTVKALLHKATKRLRELTAHTELEIET
jgi:RNA polymerase sigma-70 factor (ECF subfamily)